jgi:hypothetical protein
VEEILIIDELGRGRGIEGGTRPNRKKRDGVGHNEGKTRYV